MRVRVSQKVFIVFSTLTVFALALGATVRIGLQDLRLAGENTQLVHDLRVELSKIEILALEAFLHGVPFDYVEFTMELDKIAGLVGKVEALGLAADEDIKAGVRQLPVLIEYYRNAYEELYRRSREDLKSLGEVEGLFNSLEAPGGDLPARVRADYYRLLDSTSRLQMKIYHGRDPMALGDLRSNLRELAALKGDAATGDALRRLGLKVEENYLNYLAMENRREFLKDTSRTFSEVTGDILAVIAAEGERRQARLSFAILAIVGLAVLATIGSWRLVSAYLGRILGGLDRAVRSIRSEDFDYDLPPVTNDEFGDLAVFVKNLSHNLKVHIDDARKGRKFLQEIIDGVAEPIMVIGTDYRLKLMNRSARQSSRGGREGDGALLCYEVSHGSTSPCAGEEHPCPLASIAASGEMVTLEHVHPRGTDGDRRHIEIVASPLLSEDGSVEGIIEACRDITERKRAEASLQEAKESLEAQNAELKKMDMMKDSLIRDVSHELKTPVAKHAMQLEILKPIIAKHRLTEEEARALVVMEENVKRQESVIRNLLDLSRLESGGRKYIKKPLRLDELLRRVKEDYRHFADRYGGKITVELPPLTIRSDGEMLWHLFSNLLSNAIKFRKENAPFRVKVSSEVSDGQVTLKVADEGRGMNGEELTRAFDRFYQSSASKEGSGVGLTICKVIAEGLGGAIAVSSDGPGRGAVFSITLPME